MRLPPRSDHHISLEEAARLTANFRRDAEVGAVKGGMVWKEIVQDMMNQEGCVGLRYYFGREDNGKPVLILVGVDAEGKDMVHGIIAERTWMCPPFCPDANELNSSLEERQRGTTKRRIPSVGDRAAAPRTNEPVRLPVVESHSAE
jgi:hypothetical protein